MKQHRYRNNAISERVHRNLVRTSPVVMEESRLDLMLPERRCLFRFCAVMQPSPTRHSLLQEEALARLPLLRCLPTPWKFSRIGYDAMQAVVGDERGGTLLDASYCACAYSLAGSCHGPSSETARIGG
jgi:hypothetical protein